MFNEAKLGLSNKRHDDLFTDKIREHRLLQVNNAETSSFQIALRRI